MNDKSPSTPLPSRRLGDSELEASVVGLGCNNFGGRLDGDATAAVLEAALDAGITFFDTADIYGGAGESERQAKDPRVHRVVRVHGAEIIHCVGACP